MLIAASAAPAAAAGLDDVTRRPPGAADDTQHGYRAGDLWNVPGVAEWICDTATPGRAQWRKLPIQKLPLDSVPGVPLHGWGTRLLRTAYRGPLLGVLRAGGKPAAVMPAADGNLDPAPLPLAAEPIASSVDVTSWADQAAPGIKGGAVTLSVPDGAVAPQISRLATTGGSPFVAFADGGMNWLTDAAGNATHIQHPRLAGPGLGADAHDLSVVTVLRGAASGNTLDATVTFAGRFPISLNTQDVTLTRPLYGPASMSDGAQRGFGFYIPSTPSVFAMSASASELTAFDDDNAHYTGPAATANVVSGGMVLGGANSRDLGFADALSAVIVGPALTPQQMLALRESLTATFRLTPQLRDRVIVSGASTDAGADGWLTQAPIRTAETMLDHAAVIYNLAVAGAGLIAAPNGANVIWPFGAATLYAPQARNTYVIGAGALINTLGTGTSVGETVTALRLWLDNVHRLGRRASTVCETVMPFYTPANEARRAALNAAIRARETTCDAIADIGADPTLGNPSVLGSRAWTVAGGGHRSPAYQVREGASLGQAINRLAGPADPNPPPPPQPGSARSDHR